jgi:NADH:ubiquinone oxidoreductase subunit 6 (subunit J)
LFTGWVYAFEIASVLLLVGIVGSILVAKRRD